MSMIKRAALLLALACGAPTYAIEEPSSLLQGFSIYGEYLYWQVAQDQMQYAARLPGGIQPILDEIGSDALMITEKFEIIEPSFDYTSGFQVGAAYFDPCGSWDVDIAWTRLHQSTSSSIFDEDNGIIPLTMPASSIFGFIDRASTEFGFANEAHSRWNFDFDAIDLQLGWRHQPLCNLFLHPYFGVKAAAIRQKQHISYVGFTASELPISINNAKKNDFHGVGPSFGCGAAWEFMSGFSLYGDLSAAVLYGHFKGHEEPIVTLDGNIIDVKLKSNRHNRLRPTIDGSIGLDWHFELFSCVKGMVGIGYEVQYWWNQWQLPASVAGTLINGGLSSQGDLMLQGLTVKAGFNF